MTNFDTTPLQRVTLTFLPHGGFPQDLHFDHVTPDDLSFVLGAFHARKRRSLAGRAEVTAALDAARKSQLEWHEEQLRSALEDGLGRWRHYVPRWVRLRALDKLVEQYYRSTAMWAAEMGDLHEQVDRLHNRAREAQSHQVTVEPLVLCAADCSRAIPLTRLRDLPVGWEEDGDGRPHCPDHPVTVAPSAALVKVAS